MKRCAPKCPNASLLVRKFFSPEGAEEVEIKCAFCGYTEWTSLVRAYRRGLVPENDDVKVGDQKPTHRERRRRFPRKGQQLSFFDKP